MPRKTPPAARAVAIGEFDSAAAIRRSGDRLILAADQATVWTTLADAIRLVAIGVIVAAATVACMGGAELLGRAAP